MTLGEIAAALANVGSQSPLTDATITNLRKSLAALKSAAVARGDEVEAKSLWAYEQTVRVHELFQLAFQEMKDGDFYKAWCTLEQCELAVHFLKPHIASLGANEFRIGFVDVHVGRFQSLYPYKIFFSPEFLELEKTCSICGKPISIRHPCGHQVGEIYAGEVCFRSVTKMEFLGMATVEQPLQKYSVPFIVDPKTGRAKDHYNYEPVKYAVEALSSPYDGWAVDFTKKSHPISKFRSLGRNASCPCGSGTKFKKCCWGKSHVEMPHYQFRLAVAPRPTLSTDVLFVGSQKII